MDNSEQIRELWQEYSKDRNIEIKNQLVVLYIHLVKKIVYRMMPTYEGYSNFDDMVSSGVLGLMDAVEKFDISKQVKFEHYATMRIKGEIIDQIRKQDWAPSSLRRKIKTVTNAYSELESKLYRVPTDQEVAGFLEMKEEDLSDIMMKSHTFNIVHFEEMFSQNSFSIGNLPSNELSTEEKIEKNELINILGSKIDDLPDKEKMVITLYYYEELTLKEIAGIIGVSESRVSQIHSKVLLKLRSKVNSAIG